MSTNAGIRKEGPLGGAQGSYRYVNPEKPITVRDVAPMEMGETPNTGRDNETNRARVRRARGKNKLT